MHEYSIVSDIVHSVVQALPREGSPHVRRVRFRRGSAFAQEALEQAFEMTTRGTPLEGAELKVEAVATELTCGCGHRQVVHADEVVGHLWVCTNCGGVVAVNEHHDLELLGVDVEDY